MVLTRHSSERGQGHGKSRKPTATKRRSVVDDEPPLPTKSRGRTHGPISPKRSRPTVNDEDEMEVETQERQPPLPLVEELDEEEKTTSKLRNLFSGTCKTYHVTRLFNVKDMSEKRLSKDAKYISAALISNLPKNDVKGYTYCVLFSILEGIRKSDLDSDSLYIEVHRVSQKAARTGTNLKSVTIFMGLFTSCNSATSGVRIKNVEPSTYFPVFICNTSKKFWNIIKLELERIYSCTFVSNGFSWSNLVFLAGKWIINTGIQEGDAVKLNLKAGDGGHNAEWEVIVGLDIWEHELKRIMRRARSTQSEDECDKDIIQFWESIFSGVSAVNGIKIQSTQISKVSFQSFVATSAGRIKAKIEDISSVHTLLMNLTHILQLYKRPEEQRLRVRCR